MTDEDQKTVDEILDCFDFEKVHKVMRFLNWTWGFNHESPEIYELRKKARYLIKIVVSNLNTNTPEYETGTGGFSVSGRLYPGDTKKYIKLSFNIAEWDNYD